MARPVRPAAATDDRILAVYRRLGSAYAAAAELGVGAATVYRALAAHRVEATGRRRFTPGQVRALAREFRAGASVAQLAARHGEERNKVRRALARAGVTITPDRDGRRSAGVGGPRVPARPGEVERAVELRGRGMSLRAIAAALGRSVAFVSKALRRAGGWDGGHASAAPHPARPRLAPVRALRGGVGQQLLGVDGGHPFRNLWGPGAGLLR